MADFTHTTSAENIHRMLKSQSLYSLNHIAEKEPNTPLSVEPKLLSRSREVLPAYVAVRKLTESGKDPDKLFLVRGGYLPGYGDYVVKKELQSTKITRQN